MQLLTQTGEGKSAVVVHPEDWDLILLEQPDRSLWNRNQIAEDIGFASAISMFNSSAERYGYVNRALPDAKMDDFVDGLARRIASFDRRAIAAAKNLVNQVSLPAADRLLDALNSFQTALTWPETQQRVQALLRLGLQQQSDFEKRWPTVLGTLLDSLVIDLH